MTIKIKNHQILSIIFLRKNLYEWAISQKLSLAGFKWVKVTLSLVRNFPKNYNEDSDIGHSLEVDVQCPESFHKLHNDLPFLPKRMKLKRSKNFQPTGMTKTNMLYTQET